MVEQSETFADQPLRFSIPSRNARGRLLRLDGVLNEILSAHKYPALIEKTLAEALVLTALLGSSLKDAGGQLTIQAQTEDGAIKLLVCDYKDGALRGYVQHDAEKLALLPPDATLFGLFGKGYLAITFDRDTPEERTAGYKERALSGHRSARRGKPVAGGGALFRAVRADTNFDPCRCGAYQWA